MSPSLSVNASTPPLLRLNTVLAPQLSSAKSKPTPPSRSPSILSILKSNPNGYASGVFNLTRSIINSIINSGKKLGSRLSHLKITSLSLKATSVLNIPQCLMSLPAQTKAIGENIHRKDHEGAIIASVILTLTVGDLANSILATANVIYELASRSAGFIATMAIPLALAAITTKVALTTAHLFHLLKFKHEFNKEVVKKIEDSNLNSTELRAVINNFVGKYLDLESCNVNKCKKLERHTNSFILSKMQSLAEILKDGKEISVSEREAILNSVKEMKKSLEIERNCEIGSLVTGVVSIVGSSMLLTPIAPLAPLILVTINATAQLMIMSYRDKNQHYRLKCA